MEVDDNRENYLDISGQFACKAAVEDDKSNFEISGLTFDIMSSAEIAKASSVRVINSEMYFPNSTKPVPHGVLDLHLGANRAARGGTNCTTCGGDWDSCVGHWGTIDLQYPVFHVGYYKHLMKVLYCICKQCGKLLLDEEETGMWLARMRRARNDSIRKRAYFRMITDTAKKKGKCRLCDAPQGTLKRIVKPSCEQFLKIHHAVKSKDLGIDSEGTGTVTEDLDPLYCMNLLKKMDAIDCEVLDITRPEKLLVSSFLVPPASIRPTVTMGDQKNEDDMTSILSQIVHLNDSIKQQEAAGAPTHQILANWELLQLQAARYVNSDFPQLAAILASKNEHKVGRGVCQRLKGKEGRFRGNLSGKRVDFSGRTVISPDPNLLVSEVVVPKFSAKRLTFPERVCTFNVHKLRMAVLNGPDEWPGATNIISKDGKSKTSLRFVNRRDVADNLKLGDTVERHLWDGDVVLFNRQPSLHRLSIMAHRAKVMEWRTLRFNECVCSPYNADFDGDEMNCHLPQTQEARAEAFYLMGVVRNLTTPKNGEPLVSATQDFLSGSYMICHKDVFLTRDKLCLFCCYFSDALLQIDLPPPAILKPVELWTGKQLFTILLCPNKDAKVIVNFELKEREYEKPKGGLPPFMCRKDGYIIFHQSELVCGAVGKKSLGGGSKESLFFHLIRDNTPEIAAKCMSRVAKLTGRWFANRGMTIGIDDVTPDDHLLGLKADLVQDGYNRVQKEIDSYNSGKMQPSPGCTLEQTLEVKCKSILDNLRNGVGQLAQDNVHPLNKPLIMFLSGAKGALINLAQMIGLVGQQNVDGKRIWDGFVHRTLPHFTHEESLNGTKAKGFVANSFFSGLEPEEFFFHTMSGREGLVDTAVKTADTGYMQRRIVKALEDLAVKYDRTVRTSDGQIVQFVYGDDGLNPIHMEDKTRLLDLDKLFVHIRSMIVNELKLFSTHNRKKRKAGSEGKTGQQPAKMRRSELSAVEGDASSYPQGGASSFKMAGRDDVVLPPASSRFVHTSMLKSIVKLIEATESSGQPMSDRKAPPGCEHLPRSLRQQIQLLHHQLKSAGISGFHEKVTEILFDEKRDGALFDSDKLEELLSKQDFKANGTFDMVVDSPSDDAAENFVKLRDATQEEVYDGLINQVRNNLVAHSVFNDWLTPDKQTAALLPFEIKLWGRYLATLTAGALPASLKMAQDMAKQHGPSHQALTKGHKTFESELIAWLDALSQTVAKARLANGELAALNAKDYLRTLERYRLDTDQADSGESVDTGYYGGRKQQPPLSGHPLERRLWSTKYQDAGCSFQSSRRWRIENNMWVSVGQLFEFIKLAWRRYTKALIEPGEAVGAIGAQSIGEPGTQMTLKTFHFAGVASMNVTLGVPRIKEIINGATKIQTPIIQIPLAMNKEYYPFALMLKGKIEKTYLKEVAISIKQVFSPNGAWIVIKLHKPTIQRLYLSITAETVRTSILDQGTINKIKLRDTLVEIVNEYKLIVRPPSNGGGLLFQMRALMDGLQDVRVAGLKEIKRGVIKVDEVPDNLGGTRKEYAIAVEGLGMRDIMGMNGVDGPRVMSNNVMEVKEVLGIEAARQVIISEIRSCMDAYSMDIDTRHMFLLGDVMTFRGEVLGISRHGIQKMRASVLCLASFEETNEHLFEAAVHRKSEHVQGVSEAIILGQQVSLGTGAVDLLFTPRSTNQAPGVKKGQSSYVLSDLLSARRSAAVPVA